MRLLMTSLVVATACLVFALTSGCADALIVATAQSGDPEAQLQLFLRIPQRSLFENLIP